MTRTSHENASDALQAASLKEVHVRKSNAPLERYRILDKNEFAEIFVEAGRNETASGQDNGWVTVTIRSSFGSWGHHWSAIGDRDWREFLSGMDIDYAMGKFMGQSLMVEDLAGTIKNLHEHIAELREFSGISAEEEKRLREDYTEDEFDTVDELFSAFSSEGGTISDGYWELGATKRNPTADAFWERLWIPFCTYLTEEMELQRDGPDPVDWRDMETSDDDPGIQDAIDTAARDAADAALSSIGMTREDGPDVPILASEIEQTIGSLMWSVRGRERDAEAVREAEEEGFSL